MEERIYDYWVATLQDGYIGNIIDIVNRAGGARALYEMPERDLAGKLGLSRRLADHITDNRTDIRIVEKDYYGAEAKGISYVNHTDVDFPDKLKNIASPPYGLFVKGRLPDPLTPSVAIVGARECSEYGRIMAEYFGDRLAREGVQIISGMAWGIDGLAQTAALNAGGRSYAVLGCGVDITYPNRNCILYRRLCGEGNGLVSEYAPGTQAVSRHFPPRNRIISGLCDVLIVVEARAKSGTLITVDMAIDQGRTVMVVPGRLTDSLSAGCLKLLYQGALPATSIEAVLDQLGVNIQMKLSECTGPVTAGGDRDIPSELERVLEVMTIEPQSVERIANTAGITPESALIILTKLEIEDLIREVSPGYYVKQLEFA